MRVVIQTTITLDKKVSKLHENLDNNVCEN